MMIDCVDDKRCTLDQIRIGLAAIETVDDIGIST